MNLLISSIKWLVIFAVIIGAAGWAFLNYHPVWGGKPDAESLAKMQASKHFDSTKFNNLEPTTVRTATDEEQTSLLGWAWKMINPPAGKNPSEPLPTVKLDTANGKMARWRGWGIPPRYLKQATNNLSPTLCSIKLHLCHLQAHRLR